MASQPLPLLPTEAARKSQTEWDGMIHDYTRKRGIVHSKSCCRPTLPGLSRPGDHCGTAWSKLKKACNSQLARGIGGCLPIELSREEQVRLVRAYCSSQFVSRGMCADFNIHDTGSGNPHAHILLTMRPMDAQGRRLPKSKKGICAGRKRREESGLPSGNF